MKLILLSAMLLVFAIPQAHALYNDSIETIGYWDKETIDVGLSKGIYTSDKRIAEVMKAVTSTEFYNIEDNLMHKDRPGIYSPYYLGWQGALDNSNATLKNLNFEIASYGDIVISLTPQSSAFGFSGETWPLFVDGKIDKAYITIYDVDKISKSQLYSIVMHEMGHAIGIGHTTAPEDVMNDKRVNVPYPYVSPCIMQALDVIDDGKSTIKCKK